MKAAPAFDCARCHRGIGKSATHYLLRDGLVACSRCLGREHHGALFPDCRKHWHDGLDHLVSVGTRAGTAAVLGLWP